MIIKISLKNVHRIIRFQYDIDNILKSSSISILNYVLTNKI